MGYFWIFLLQGGWDHASIPLEAWHQTIQVEIEVEDAHKGKISIAPESIPVPLEVRWVCPRCEQPLSPGHWSAEVLLKPAREYANPGSPHYRMLPLAILKHPVRLSEDLNQNGVANWRYRMSQEMQQSPYLMKPLLLALMFGDKSLMKADHWQVMRDTGTAHLLAISGLHLTMVATSIYTIIYLLTRVISAFMPSLSSKPIAWIISCLFSFPYILVTGNQISAWRAYVMMVGLSWVVMGKRQSFTFQDLSWVTVIVILIQPHALFSMSLWLSVSAIGLILLIHPHMQALPTWQRILFMQWRLSLALGLMACMMMHTLSLSSPLANIIAIPYVSVIVVPLCFLATVLLMISSAWATPLLTLADLSIQPLWWGLSRLSSLMTAPALWITNPWQWVCASLIVLSCTLPSTRLIRWLSLILWLGVLCPIPPHPAKGQAWVDVLDVGQGLAIVVRTKSHILVYDTGAGLEGKAVADQTLLPFLYHEHINHIHTLMISHADNDHRGGYATLTKQLKVDNILSGEPQDSSEQPCHAGQAWTWDEVEFVVLSPGTQKLSEGNNLSCVLKISAGEHSVLLTGDIEAPAERALLSTELLQADVLLAPHHGSKTSSTEAFLKAVNPQHAIISAGLMNPYHHPHVEVVDRYQHQAIKLWNTAHNGALHVKISKSGASVLAYKEGD